MLVISNSCACWNLTKMFACAASGWGSPHTDSVSLLVHISYRNWIAHVQLQCVYIPERQVPEREEGIKVAAV